MDLKPSLTVYNCINQSADKTPPSHGNFQANCFINSRLLRHDSSALFQFNSFYKAAFSFNFGIEDYCKMRVLVRACSLSWIMVKEVLNIQRNNSWKKS